MLNIPFKWEQQQSWQQRKIKKPGRRQEKEPCSLLVTWQDVFHASMNTLLKLQPISQATSKVIRPSRINVFATKLFTRNSVFCSVSSNRCFYKNTQPTHNHLQNRKNPILAMPPLPQNLVYIKRHKIFYQLTQKAKKSYKYHHAEVLQAKLRPATISGSGCTSREEFFAVFAQA